MRKALYAVLAVGLAAAPLVGHAETNATHEKQSERSKKWAQKLGLSEEQAAKLKLAREENRKAVAPLREQLKKDMETLRAQVKQDASGADIQKTLDRLGDDRKALRARFEEMRSSVDKIVTDPKQKAKMVLAMARRMKHGRWKSHKESDE